ncbi:TMEM175 family protein [Sphingomonas sp.]|uniref:TMEM175 family protein n=1 Tax=Sphingomonas sp. TaxID=28214 RepID=UPI001B008E19|nr:TMEM175 family protein [Sphingomonas sp.]MBO9713561.1 DUF1211 domain-containing protein [Sphingomonas sp.]
MTDAHHESEPHGPGHALERLIFFSDAVFAIAITLLVIELRFPEVHQPASDADYLRALARMVPNFVGFLVSFFVIGAFWMGHHRAFDCARHWSPKLFMPNLMLLCAIAAMPFFTALSSEHWAQRVPIMLYCGWLLVIALLNMRLQRIVTSPPVASARIAPALRRMIRHRGLSVALGAATALAVSYFYPWLGQIMLLSIPLWRRLLGALPDPRAQPSG